MPPAKPGKAADSMKSAYDMLDKLATPDTGNEPEKTPETTPEPEKHGAEDEPAPVEKPEEKPPVKPDEKAEKPQKAKSLREAYEALKPEVERLRTENAELKKKSGNAEQIEAAVQAERDKASALQKRVDEYETELRYHDFQKSAEYKDKYWSPYEEAYLAGREWVQKLSLQDGDAVRKGTPEDFDRIMQAYINDPDTALPEIEQMFGSAKASSVMNHIKEVEKLNSARLKALDTWKKDGAAKLTERAEQQKQAQAALAGVYRNEVTTAEAKYKQWSEPLEGDAKHAEIIAKGKELADAAFGGDLKDAEGKAIKLTPAERAKIHAAVRNKSAWFDGVVYQLQKALAEIKARDKKLAEYEASEPRGGSGRRGGEETPTGNHMDQAMAELGKRAR